MPVELADSYESIYRNAMTQMGMGNADQAIELLLRIVNRLRRLRPETLQRKSNLQNMLTTAWHDVTEFLRWEKRYDEAIAVCESVTGRLADTHSAPSRIASLRIEKGEVQEGLAQLREIAETSSLPSAWLDLGTEYMALQQYDQAEKAYQTALSLAESNQEAAIMNAGLYQVYKETDRVDQALGAWNMAIVLDPDLSTQSYRVYRWLIERGDLDRAAKYLQRELDPVRSAFYRGLLEWQAGQKDAAQARWQKILQEDVSQQETAIELWMEAALRLNEPERVIELTRERSSQGSSFSKDQATLIGIAYTMLGQIDEAKGWFEQVIVRLRREWPSREQIPAPQWTLLNDLGSDPDAIESVSAYFEC